MDNQARSDADFLELLHSDAQWERYLDLMFSAMLALPPKDRYEYFDKIVSDHWSPDMEEWLATALTYHPFLVSVSEALQQRFHSELAALKVRAELYGKFVHEAYRASVNPQSLEYFRFDVSEEESVAVRVRMKRSDGAEFGLWCGQSDVGFLATRVAQMVMTYVEAGGTLGGGVEENDLANLLQDVGKRLRTFSEK